jgi:hypothetical protein
MLNALLPLQRLTSRGVAVLILHHPAKGRTRAGQAARGSGALSGYADILIEMRHYGKSSKDERRRALLAWSRFQQTPRRLVVEWTADGTDYLARDTLPEQELAGHWRTMRAIFGAAPHKLTRADLSCRWPRDDRPHRASLARWLEQAAADGLLKQDGQGVRGCPYRYWLPEREEEWRNDSIARCLMPELGAPSAAAAVAPPALPPLKAAPSSPQPDVPPSARASDPAPQPLEATAPAPESASVLAVGPPVAASRALRPDAPTEPQRPTGGLPWSADSGLPTSASHPPARAVSLHTPPAASGAPVKKAYPFSLMERHTRHDAPGE